MHGKDFLYLKCSRNNAQKLLLFTLPPIIVGFYFIGLRPFNSGGDTIPYLWAFSKLNNPLTATVDANYGSELLFWPVQAVLKFFLHERGWLIANYIIVVFLTLLAYLRATRDTKLSPFIFPLVFLTFFAVFSGNAMRQVYSIPIGVMAFYYCHKKENIKYFVCAFFSIAFHWSAVIVLVSPLFARIPSRTLYYVAIPMLALFSSVFISPVVDLVINITGLDWLTVKSEAYLKGGRVSHITAVWHTLNFWLCVSIYILLIFLKLTSEASYSFLSKYFLIFMSLMLFSVHNADISERYMAWFLFLSPIALVLIVSRIKLPANLKNLAIVFVFGLMAVLVYTRESTIITLGINL